MKKANKKRRGRPATGVTPKRYFRMDDESYGLVEQAAELSGQSVSEYIRTVLIKDAAFMTRPKRRSSEK